MEGNIIGVIRKLFLGVFMNDKEKEVFKIANNALYFADNSDYGTALWEILRELKPEMFANNSCPKLDFIDD